MSSYLKRACREDQRRGDQAIVARCHMSSLYVKSTKTEKQNQAHRYREQIGGC